MCRNHPDAPAAAADLCAACIAVEYAWKAPYVALIIDAAQALGWDDLAHEAMRRIGLYEVGVEYERMLQ